MIKLSEPISGVKTSKSRKADQRGRAAEPLRPGGVLVASVRAARRDWRRILSLAIPVALIGAGVEILLDHYVDPSNSLISVGAWLTAVGVTTAGTVLLAGFICRLISAAERGGESVTLPQVAKSLPWWRLIAADVIASLAALAGLVLLVIPGLAALTFFAVVGPVIEIEHQKVFAGLRRSAALTRPHVWPVVLLATVPLLLTSALEAVAPEPHHAADIPQFLVIRGLTEGVLEACVAVLLVELCFRLIDLHAADAAKSAPPPGGEVAARLVS